MATFSILYRIVGSVTAASLLAKYGGLVFQYPLSDRGLCNLEPELYTVISNESFSILYRIVGSVTNP